jgi:hypothetical protein
MYSIAAGREASRYPAGPDAQQAAMAMAVVPLLVIVTPTEEEDGDGDAEGDESGIDANAIELVEPDPGWRQQGIGCRPNDCDIGDATMEADHHECRVRMRS